MRTSFRRFYDRQRGKRPDCRFYALYGIFRQNIATGMIEGYIENSFSMGWSVGLCRAWAKSDAGSLLSRCTKEPGYKYFISRLTRKGASRKIIADFEFHKETAIRKGNVLSSFDFRNIPFTINGKG